MLANLSDKAGSNPGASASEKYSFANFTLICLGGSNLSASQALSSFDQCTAPGAKSPASMEMYKFRKMTFKFRSLLPSSSVSYGR